MSPTFQLSVEIRAIEPSRNHPNPNSTLVIFYDPQDSYSLGSNLDELKTAILATIPHLGTNFRYPLFFNLQILPGDRRDAFIASTQTPSPRLRQRRQPNH